MFTKEQERISRKNKKLALKYFITSGQIPQDHEKYQYVMHHINPDWIVNDVERYIQWNVEDLVVMTKSEHSRLHMTGRKLTEEGKRKLIEANTGKHPSQETIDKISKALTGKFKGELNPMYGKHHSEETKEKLRNMKLGEASSWYGKHWYNNGIIEKSAFECPEGFTKGRLKRNK